MANLRAHRGGWKRRVTNHWTIFCVLVGAAFFARGLYLLCYFPPLEGPDEYQHIAYLVHMNEEGQPPVYRQAEVPPSLYPDLVEQPHSDYDWEQTRKVGCVRYRHFYGRTPGVKPSTPIPLYQAQHPPAYYSLVAPLYEGLRSRFTFRTTVYALRILNLAFAATGLVFFLLPAVRLFRDATMARLVVLAISLLPMWLVYVTRISNDALAVLFSGVAFYLLTRLPGRRPVLLAGSAGILLAMGVQTKLIAILFLPAAVVYLVLLALGRQLRPAKALEAVAALLITYAVLAGPFHFRTYQAFDTPFPAQETVINKEAGRSTLDLLKEARPGHLRSFFYHRLVRQNLWTSGWSFLNPKPGWIRAFTALLGFSLLGLIPACWVWRKERSPPTANGYLLLFLLLTVGSGFAASYTHALQSMAAHGVVVTPPYYVMPVYPAFLMLCAAGASGYRHPLLTRGVPLLMGGLFVATEFHSLWTVAMRHWAHRRTLSMAVERLELLHPSWIRPAFGPFILALWVILVVGLVVLAFRRSGGRRTPCDVMTAPGPPSTSAR